MMFSTQTRAFGVVCVVVSTLALGCGPPDTFDREQMLRDTVDEVILPTHEKLATSAEELETATTDFCNGDRTEEQLQTAREKWKTLQAPLKHIQAWSFNMSPYRGSNFDILFYKVDREPSDGENIEAAIAGDQAIDESFIESRDYRKSTTGFPAVEYLLFGSPENGETKAWYGSNAENADRRCKYLTAATKHARGVTDRYVEAWDPEGGDFAGDFRSGDSERMGWTTVQDSIDAMVSQMVFVTKQRISVNLLGGPLGQSTSTGKIPNAVSSPHAQYSMEQIDETLVGMEKLYQGPDGKSLADYAKFRKKSVHNDVVNQMETVRSALEDIPKPLESAVEDDRAAVESAQADIDTLTSTIEADLKTTLGASTTRVVVDND